MRRRRKFYNHAREARENFTILPLETAFLANFRLPKKAPQAKKLRPRFKLSEIAEKIKTPHENSEFRVAWGDLKGLPSLHDEVWIFRSEKSTPPCYGDTDR